MMVPCVSRLPLRLLWLLFLGLACSLHDYHLADSPPPIQDVIIGAPVTVRRSCGSFIETSPGVKHGELISCIRLRIPSVSRLGNIVKYADSFRVKVETSARNGLQTPQKVEFCFHGNESLELGQCLKESWQTLEKGSWNGMMSPFETRFLDIRIRDSLTDVPLTVSVDKEFWPFRLVFLGCGLILLLVAPVMSSWVPFYYSSAMMLGIFLIILVLLFQGMKLLPTGRKSTLYIVLYGSVVGMGTVILHYFTGFVSSISKELGINHEAYNPIAIFLIVGIALMGAWLGYWGVRKMVLSEDGTVDIGTAQFVKWAIRIVASVMILQSSHDPILAMLALLVGISLTWTIRKLHLQDLVDTWDVILSFWQEHLNSKNYYNFQSKKSRTDPQQFSKAEFLSKHDNMFLRNQTGIPYRGSPVSSKKSLPEKSQGTPSPSMRTNSNVTEQEYYSTFHKTPSKKQMSQTEWTHFTQEYTKKSMQELTASPKFADWFAKNAERVMILPTEHREDRSADEIQRTAHMVQAEENEGVSKSRFFGF